MKIFYGIFLTVLILSSCRIVTPTSYTANPSNVTDPISVMRNTIQQQPAAYAYMPSYLEVDNQCIKLYIGGTIPIAMPILGGGGGVIAGPGASNVLPEFVCYQNIGKIGLSHVEGDNVWRIEIDDKRGNYMYWVYTYERSEAERFIDAIYTFIKIQK